MRKCGEDLSEYGYRKLEGYKLCSIDELDMFSITITILLITISISWKIDICSYILALSGLISHHPHDKKPISW